MAKVPEDIKRSIKNLASNIKKKPEEIFSELKELMKTDSTIQQMKSPERQLRFAHVMLLRRYSGGGGSEMYLRPLSKPRIRMAKSQGKMKHVGDFYALARLIEEDDEGNEQLGDTQIIGGTLWEKAAEMSKTLSPKKVYKTSLRVTKNNATNGLEISGNDANFVEEDADVPTVEEFFKENISPKLEEKLITIDDVHLNVADDKTDYRVIKGYVLNSSTGESEKMGEFGLYSVTDDSYVGKDNFPVFTNPDEIEWGMGTTLYIVGQGNQIGTDKNGKPVVRFEYMCSTPVPGSDPIPKDEEPQPVQEKAVEEVDIDDIGSDLEEEETQEPVEEETKEETEEEAEEEKPKKRKEIKKEPEPEETEDEEEDDEWAI